MTKVAILPERTNEGISYRAVAGDKQSVGETPGQALDAITAQLSEEDRGTLVIVQNLRPDLFFSAEQQQRLGELMTLWRAARDVGASLSNEEQSELDRLIEAEIRASGRRADAMLNEL